MYCEAEHFFFLEGEGAVGCKGEGVGRVNLLGVVSFGMIDVVITYVVGRQRSNISTLLVYKSLHQGYPLVH